VNAVPATPAAVYGTTVNGPYCVLLARPPLYVYEDAVWLVATVPPFTKIL
jgi:hypothetical protein